MTTMKVNIIIDTGNEQFEVLLTRAAGPVRLADGTMLTLAPDGLRDLWRRGSLDAWTWVSARMPGLEATDGGNNGGNDGPDSQR